MNDVDVGVVLTVGETLKQENVKVPRAHLGQHALQEKPNIINI